MAGVPWHNQYQPKRISFLFVVEGAIAGITCRKWCEFICGSGGLVRNFLRNLRLRKADEMFRPYAISFSDGLPYESLGGSKQLVINLLCLFYETITTRACRVVAWFSVFN